MAMTTISHLVGWDPAHPSPQPALDHLDKLNPDDYPALVPAARALDLDLRTAHAVALAHTTDREREHDRAFLERAAEFVELHEQVDASTQLLSDLASFLSTFQHDLSAVSGHIAELQGRSKSIEARLKARKAVERSLHPFLSSIAIPPALITTIVDTDVDDAWIPAVRDLDNKLGAIRGGARVDSRRNLDEAAEALRVAASSKILTHLVSLLKPYTLSLSSPLSTLHASLTRLKPLFDFLRRHAARQAHEFQKAYAQTARWYLETGFRRYVRALEKIRTAHPAVPAEPIGSVAGVADALALLQQRKTTSPAAAGRAATARPTATSVALDNAQVGGGPAVIVAHAANDRHFHPPPEALFRSASLVLADNASAEHAFVAYFFGHHSELDLPHSQDGGGGGGGSGSVPGLRRSATEGSLRSAAAGGSEGGRMAAGQGERDERMRSAVVDALWKTVLEPAIEYTRNFLHALLDPTPPAPIALLAMLRLTESLSLSLVSSSPSPAPLPTPTPPAPNSTSAPPTPARFPPCPPLDPHLSAVRLSLLQCFARALSAQVDSLRRINGSPSPGPASSSSSTSTSSSSSSGVSGLLARATGAAGPTTTVKDSVVTVIVGRYCELFNAAVALLAQGEEDIGGEEGVGVGRAGAARERAAKAALAGREREHEDEVRVQAAQDQDTVFSALLRLRQELDKLVVFQAAKIPDRAKASAFLRAQCDELLQGLSAGLPSHARTQAEVAHWREVARKAS
ncbi:Sac2 family-domain-containing protein [Rhodotorula diobovata]|uniref:Sac2 family-domain-containing protein n=1 Tax=Rhodotorula diobovata TaxID=5288 RepID=A0A5C5FUR7_9BASI|nr:Sac2 family-domain-containing protein [Rhodotorula diobovata]